MYILLFCHTKPISDLFLLRLNPYKNVFFICHSLKFHNCHYATIGCSFESPKEHSYNMLRGSAYEQGRIQQQDLEKNDCAMKITDIKSFENGQWECQVTTKMSDGNYKSGIGEIKVIVAEPPKQVYLTSETKEQISNSMNLTYSGV